MTINDADDDLATFALAQAVSFAREAAITTPQEVVDAADLFVKFLRRNGRKRGDTNAV